MTIKKNFVELYTFLESNKSKKLETLMPEILKFVESKQRDSNHRTNENGDLEVYCYYHEEWELVTQVPYGTKSNTVTGLNSMCKVGVNCWTRQQRNFKKAKADLLSKVAEKPELAQNLTEMIQELETDKDRIMSLVEFHEAEAHLMNKAEE